MYRNASYGNTSNHHIPLTTAGPPPHEAATGYHQQQPHHQTEYTAATATGTTGRSDPPATQRAVLEDGETYISRTLYICKLPPDFNEEEIRQACTPFGDWDLRDAQNARHGLINLHIGGRLVDVQYSKTQNDKVKERNTGTLYVRPVTTERNFYDPNTLQQYKDLFARFGDVKKVNTNRKREAEKFVEFHDLRAAETALEGLNGLDFNGVKLEVQFANQQSKTINKDAMDVAPPLPSAPPKFRRDSSNPPSSYGSAREPGFQDPPTPSANPVSSPTSSSSYYGPPVKLHWSGKFGPSATLSGVTSIGSS